MNSLRIPRITSGHSSATIERMIRRWTIWLGLVVATVLLAYTGSHLFGQLYLLLFASVLFVSVLGGMGLGLLVLAAIMSYEAVSGQLSVDELQRLLIEGTLVSIGASLRAARLKAREHLEAKRRLEQKMIEIGEDERRRIGRDLHDGLGQHLTGIALLSETMAQQLEAGEQPDPVKAETITRLVSQAVGITRDLAKSLSPITLEYEGFQSAVEELAETSSSLFGIRCTCEYKERDLVLDQTRSLHLFRIVQEAVNNSVRHGKAKNVRISLSCSGKKLIVRVVDDGIGLSQKTSIDPGLGLRIMKYRARVLGASLTAERAAPEGGTVVTCICPVDDEMPRR